MLVPVLLDAGSEVGGSAVIDLEAGPLELEGEAAHGGDDEVEPGDVPPLRGQEGLALDEEDPCVARVPAAEAGDVAVELVAEHPHRAHASRVRPRARATRVKGPLATAGDGRDTRPVSMTAADIIGHARDLAPVVQARADEIAAGRRLPDDLVEELRLAGVFRMPMPRAWGGPEMTPADQTEVVEVLSTADPSTGWCVMIGSDAGFYSAFLDEAPGKELFGDLDTITAGWLVPAGRAEVVDGGYRVTGRWSFGSSCLHADVMVGGCLVFDGGDPRVGANGLPSWRVAVAPAERWQILDTWHTTGLAGSGSNDYVTDDLFVPDDHTFSLVEPPVRAGPLYAFPGMFFANTAGVPLGLARRAVDETKAVADEKVLMPEMVAMRDVPRVRGNIARAEMMLGASRAFTYRTLDAVWARLQAHGRLDTALRVDLALSRVHAFRTAREVAQLMVDTVGTQAVFATSPLDRLLRDAITMSQHIVAQDRMAEMVGGMALGADSPYPFV